MTASFPVATERLLVLLVVLNLFDALFTLGAVAGGVAIEVNPLMAEALHVGPVVFMATKMGLVCLGVALLHRLCAATSAAFLAAIAAVLVYGYAVGRHVYGLVPYLT